MTVNQALDALKRKDYAKARALIAKEDVGTYTLTHFAVKGLAELALQDWAAALKTFALATARFPDHALFWLNRGMAEENLKHADDAFACYERCVKLAPGQAEACGNLSNLYRSKGRFAEAEDMARRALANGADKGDALNALGLALMSQGKFEESRKAFLEAKKAAPGNPVILFNLANLDVELFRFDAAWANFAAARRLDDRAVFRRDEGMARLLSGDYEKGFALFEARLEDPDMLRIKPPCPLWRGESLKGKRLMIVAEQGFGDVIHFCRYQDCLTEGDLVWAVPESLVRLLSGALRGEVLDEKGALPACDYYVPVMSLGLYSLRRSWGRASPHPPQSQERLGPLPLPQCGRGRILCAPTTPLLPKGTHRLKVGLVWAGSKTHARDYERSVPLRLFAPLFKALDADFYAPFLGEALDEIGDFPVQRLDRLITDFADTAALLKQLDFLVSVDTVAAHLGGALGVRTFVLVSHCPDWRWGIAEKTSHLYPSVTIVRQPRYGDWEGAVRKVVLAITG